MRYLVFLFIFSGIFSNTNAQSFEARYSANIPVSKELASSHIDKDILFTMQNAKKMHTLTYNSGISIFSYDSLVIPENGAPINNQKLFNLVHYKDFTDDKIYTVDVLNAANTGTVGNLSSQLEWVITNDKFKMLGYDVQEAYCFQNNKKITAYFTSQIRIPEGPFEYHGLPGMIVKIIRGDEIISLESIEFKENCQTDIKLPPAQNMLSAVEFADYKKNKIREYYNK